MRVYNACGKSLFFHVHIRSDRFLPALTPQLRSRHVIELYMSFINTEFESMICKWLSLRLKS